MSSLLVGFDSAWTVTNSGALVGALQLEDGTVREIGPPQTANYREAEATIQSWQSEYRPTATVVLLDQPTIVRNATGQRPVENLAAAPVSRRYGGMQPANTGRVDMFGGAAPVWPFLGRFDGPADPLAPPTGTRVFETYPVLAMIALGWMVADSRPTGRLPKYNPERRKTFALSEWRYVCTQAANELRQRGLSEAVEWLDEAAGKTSPRKRDQDCLDAYLCLVVAFHFAGRNDCLMVGDLQTGYIVVPYGAQLHAELDDRCHATGRVPSEWVRAFRMSSVAT